ncbi:hypothetical protein L0V05_00785 [Tabrizicola sp. J26]|uniref:hypothetical protein n=1 Tax=Alitabrizicola rongguiensis TaxID=2909234 RepID=UPI001F15E747|nr:hypothetical protein [Tabrizicola rongguiensis]MCF1707340.1 hypothetical protein [Tabrizicola rongguiensis]
MRILRVALIGLAVVVASTSLSLAEVVYSKGGEAVYQFDPPKGWKLRKGTYRLDPAPAGMSETPPIYSLRPKHTGDSMWVGTWSPDHASTIKEFGAKLKGLRGRLMSKSHVTYTDKRVINGLPVGIWAATGMREGKWYDLAFAAVQIQPDELAVVAFIGERADFDRYEKELSDMLATVRPAGEAK